MAGNSLNQMVNNTVCKGKHKLLFVNYAISYIPPSFQLNSQVAFLEI